jgi:cytochrome c oxidase cbb3-type subunit 4
MAAGLLTLMALAAFLGGIVWAMSDRRRGDFDAAARLPLDDDPEPGEANDSEGPRT